LVERIDKKGVQVWDLTEERMLQLLEAAPVRGRTAISKDGKLLATADVDTRQVRLFDVASGKPKHSLADGLGGASELVFSPNGEALVAANYDNDIRVWKTRSGELVRKIEDMTGAMFAAQFTPDGKQLLMAGLDETIYVLDGASFQKVRTIKGHGETIAALAISPNGKLFVTGGFDVRTTQNPVKVVIWDAATGKALKTVSSPHRVIALAFSPDSRWIAMTSGEKEIALFQAQ
jgi:WD40 repeat protein